MRGWLLDTNVISEPTRQKPDENVLAFLRQGSSNMHLSDVTVAEIRRGIGIDDHKARRERILHWLESVILVQFDGRIIPLSERILVDALSLMHETRRKKATLSTPDLLIAGSAVAENLVVVSRDSTPYRQADVAVLDPWSGLFYAPDTEPMSVNLDQPDLLERLQ